MGWPKSNIGVFLLKVLGIYLIWYLIYELWLLPQGSLDAWLTTNIASVSTGILKQFGFKVYASGRLLGIGASPGIYLADGCSGISAIGLLIGFVVAYPGRWVPRLAFITMGIGIIYLTNILRNIILAITQLHWPGFFDFTHTYSTTTIFYLVIFALWVVWINYGERQAKQYPSNEMA